MVLSGLLGCESILEPYPFHFVLRQPFLRPVVKLGRARAFRAASRITSLVPATSGNVTRSRPARRASISGVLTGTCVT